MKKEIIEFKDIVTDLYAISESPNFSDDMRTRASELQYYINKSVGNFEPIIEKSGETFVARFKGIDYLWTGNFLSVMGYKQPPEFDYFKKGLMPTGWKQISEIEITDEIAKLRPMVKCVNGKEVIGTPQQLIHIVDIQCFTLKEKPINPEHYHSTNWMHINKCNLATVSDLAPEPESDESVRMCLKCYCANDPARVTCSECGGTLSHE